MVSLADIKTYILTWVLYFQLLFNKIRIYFGLIPTKHDIVGHFMYGDLPCSSLVHPPSLLANQKKYNNFRPDDLAVLTYAKAGTHLTMGVIQSIYATKGLAKVNSLENIISLEMRPAMMVFFQGFFSTDPNSTQDMDDCKSPRLLVSHLPWRCLPQPIQDGKVKTIHCMRNIKDVACSGFPFMTKMNLFIGGLTWDKFFNLFFSENMFTGSYISYLKDWYPHRNQSNLLNLTFEAMIKDLDGHVRRIAQFIGIELTEEEVKQVVFENTFANKKKSSGKYHPIYNKGKSGSWRSKFTVEQNDFADAYIEENMKDMPDLKLEYE